MNLKRTLIALMALAILPGMAVAGDEFEDPVTIRILVTKDFNDNNPAEVDVNLTCTTGLPLSQDATISDGDPVVFVVEEITDFGNLECAVTETGGTTGYQATYYANDVPMNLDGCLYEGENDLDDVAGLIPVGADLEETNECNIVNELQRVKVTVTKEWEFDSNADGIDDKARIGLTCFNIPQIKIIREGTAGYQDSWKWWVNGDESNSVWVYPNWRDNAYCTVQERIFDSAVESSGCENRLPLALGSSGVGCTITNTVFFEGIPTLSQYGMAIMALLMLGVGFIGFRRLV